MNPEFKIGQEVIYMFSDKRQIILADKETPHKDLIGNDVFPDDDFDYVLGQKEVEPNGFAPYIHAKKSHLKTIW